MWYLLTNDLYLYLLLHQHQIKKVNYSKLQKETNKCRQTLSKYYNQLLEEDVLSEDESGCIIVNDVFDLTEEEIKLIEDKVFKVSAVYIAYLICKGRFPKKSDTEISNILGVSFSAIKAIKHNMKINNMSENNIYIYAIVYDKTIKYVGSTEHLDRRIEQHHLKRPFISKDNFIVLEKCNRVNRFEREAFYRKGFRPDWNVDI